MTLKRFLIFLFIVWCCHKTVLWFQPFGTLLDDVTFSRQVHDRNSRLLRMTLAKDDIYRVRTRLNEISPLALEATLLYEDRYFYFHPGVNPISLVRASWTTFVKQQRVVGASTITMQLSRYLYKIDSRTITGKLKQIIRALLIEFLYSKEEILETYLNVVPYGFNIEGIGAASHIYFRKEPNRLSLLEALTLAVIPQSPHVRTKHIKEKRKASAALQQSRAVLLKQWLKAFPENVDKALDFSLELDMRHPGQLPFRAPHLACDMLENSSSELLKTTIDLSLQSAFETVISKYTRRRQKEAINNASVMLVDTNTMETLAVVGSADFFSNKISGQVNGTRARRSPGSALKPFVYALAMEQGLIHQQTMLKDTPTPFGTYTPDNFDRAFSGPLSAMDALIHSRNIPAIHLAGKISDPDLYGFLKKAGIPLNDDSKHYGLSIVLGTAEVTMEELVELYAMLKNNGRMRHLKKLLKEPYQEGQPFLTAESCFLVLEMLSHNPRPSGETSDRWLLRPQNVAWKTGTSVGFRDAWAIGVFDHYVLAVWIGNFSGRGNQVFVGRHAAGPLLFELIQALAKLQEVHFEEVLPQMQLNVSEIEVCSLSGQIPHRDCPHRKRTWFIPGVSPISQCQVHRRLEIDIISGMQVCPSFEGPTKSLVFEFWPTDLLKLFKQAGVGRRVPPALHPQCQQEVFGDIGPKIISPKKDIVYNLRTKGSDSKMIPLIAVGDGNVTIFSWFVDNQPVGQSKVQHPLLWKAQPGRHLVKVIDEFGRSAVSSIEIRWVD